MNSNQINTTQLIITTDLIQKCLDENKALLQAIIDSQNIGRLEDCSLYQEKLQQNLIFLASLADTEYIQKSRETR